MGQKRQHVTTNFVIKMVCLSSALKHIHSIPNTSTHVTMFLNADATDFCSHFGNSIVSIVVSNFLVTQCLRLPLHQILYWLNLDKTFWDMMKSLVGCLVFWGDGLFSAACNVATISFLQSAFLFGCFLWCHL